MKARLALLIPLISMVTTPALAHHYEKYNNRADRIEREMDRQHWRIKKGIKRGDLTRHEAKSLRKQQRRIAHLKNDFMHDGYLDRYEHRKLVRKLNKASNRIYRLKHNNQYRYRAQSEPTHKKSRYKSHYNGKEWSVMLNISDYF